MRYFEDKAVAGAERNDIKDVVFEQQEMIKKGRSNQK